jgi:hypothetical protein
VQSIVKSEIWAASLSRKLNVDVTLTISLEGPVSLGTFGKYKRTSTMPDYFSPRIGNRMEVAGSFVSVIEEITYSLEGTGITVALGEIFCPLYPSDYNNLDAAEGIQKERLRSIDAQLRRAGWQRM